MNAVGLLVALVAGAVSFASPCCLPMVPVYVSYLLGTTPEGPAATAAVPVGASSRGGTVTAEPVRVARRRALQHALVFVAGFTTVFVALWASVGMVGYLLRDYVGLLRVIGGAVLVLFGLHVAGLVEISMLYRQVQLPLRRVLPGVGSGSGSGVGSGSGSGVGSGVRTAPGQSGPHYTRSLLLGVVFAAGWTPCVGPILGGIIGLASVSGSVLAGTTLLIAYAVGLGLPFVLVALGVNEVSRRMRWLTVHHVGVGLVTGGALMITGFLMITNLFAKLSGALPAVSL